MKKPGNLKSASIIAHKKLFPVLLLLTLMACFYPAILSAQEDWVMLFQDSFDSFENWHLDPGWAIEEIENNSVLSGTDHTWAALNLSYDWSDYSFKIRLKLIKGMVHLNYRLSDNGRYYIGFHREGIYLEKEYPRGEFHDLANAVLPIGFNTWYNVEIIGQQGTIKVYVNGNLGLEYTDAKPLLSGQIAMETLEDSNVWFDDVEIIGPTAKSLPAYTWVRTGGPIGGLGYDVRIHPENPEIMFVTDNPSGVNKSYDGGNTWKQRNTGIGARVGPSLDAIPIFSLTIDPNNPDIVWAGTQDIRGIYKSTDGGETWTKMVNGISEGDEISFRNFGIHPRDSDVVFAGAEIATGILGAEFDKAKGKIYKTEDSGQNWQSVWEGDSLARFVLFDFDNPSIMYASTGIFDREAFNETGVGILRSTDGGNSWYQINDGIPDSEGNRFVGFLEMHPDNPKILFAASGNNAKGEGGVFRTTDGGDNWEKVLDDDIFTAVTISPSNTDVIYAGSGTAFYRSDDGGNTWKKFYKETEWSWGPPGVRAGVPISAVVAPDDPYTVFANNYGGGNFKSTDGGETWVNASKGYTGAHLHDVSISGNTVYVIGRSGPFKSFNKGDSWVGIAFSPATMPEWYAVESHPRKTDEILISDEFQGTIFKSTDGGDNWREVFRHPNVNLDEPTDIHGFKDIAYAPSNPAIIYAGMSRGRRTIDGNFPPGPSFGMYKSTDGGDTWFEINNGLDMSLININCVAVHPANPNIAYIGTWRDGVYKTIDGGENWTYTSNGLVSSDVRSLAIDPNNPEVVYAGLGEGVGVFKTTTGGELWQTINRGIRLACPSYLLSVGQIKQRQPLESLEMMPSRTVRSDYYSVQWTSIWDIAIDPKDPRTLYAADHNP
mgnify:CR=1 FL=1